MKTMWLALGAALATALAGCGQKGPLYLPEKPGAVVTTPRTEVHWVVSEHGAACLKGKSTAERARALIGLAHPKFRDELTAEARRLRYL